jgi:hypothetical protein
MPYRTARKSRTGTLSVTSLTSVSAEPQAADIPSRRSVPAATAGPSLGRDSPEREGVLSRGDTATGHDRKRHERLVAAYVHSLGCDAHLACS